MEHTEKHIIKSSIDTRWERRSKEAITIMQDEETLSRLICETITSQCRIDKMLTSNTGRLEGDLVDMCYLKLEI